MSGEEQLIAGRYLVTRRLGSGGMGVVWLAYDERLHRRVAIKELLMPAMLSGPEVARAGERIKREGRIAAKLQHPHLITVYDVIETAGRTYLIMEYMPSTSLAQALAERGTLPAGEVARLGAQAAAGLAAAHAGGVVHRDVKPGNVLLGADGTVKITDFGVARAVEDATATTTGMIAGTPAFLSPEVAQGRPATFASDTFSLGATLYAAVEGAPPCGTGDNAMALLHRVASGQLTAPAKAGPLTALLEHMLSVDPDHRPAMADVAGHLAALADERPEPIEARPEPPPSAPETETVRVAGARGRRRGVLTAAAVALIGLTAAALLLALNRDDLGPGSSAVPTSSAEPASSAAPPATSSAQRTVPPATTGPAPGTPPPKLPNPPAPQAEPRSQPEVITGYYALMPGNLEQAWTWLTPRYQANPAGGYGGYQTFWGRIRSVRASEVTDLPGDAVEATVEYAFADGRVVRERHRYFLTGQEGRWKIDRSAVLSSVTL